MYARVVKANLVISSILGMYSFATKKFIDSACPKISNSGGFVKGNGVQAGSQQSLPGAPFLPLAERLELSPICYRAILKEMDKICLFASLSKSPYHGSNSLKAY